MAAILVVDDEVGVRELLSDALRLAGHEPVAVENGEEALVALRRRDFELCVVDINMPGLDGFGFLEALRSHGDSTAVILLSARDAPADVARGLREGADDYVRKPFSLEELMLRVAAILRRAGLEESETRLRVGPLELWVEGHEATLDGEVLDLSATEFRLLEALLERRGRVATREALLGEVWGIDFESQTSVLDTYISYLRRKIHREGFAPIVTVRGVGFKLVDAAT